MLSSLERCRLSRRYATKQQLDGEFHIFFFLVGEATRLVERTISHLRKVIIITHSSASTWVLIANERNLRKLEKFIHSIDDFKYIAEDETMLPATKDLGISHSVVDLTYCSRLLVTTSECVRSIQRCDFPKVPPIQTTDHSISLQSEKNMTVESIFWTTKCLDDRPSPLQDLFSKRNTTETVSKL